MRRFQGLSALLVPFLLLLHAASAPALNNAEPPVITVGQCIQHGGAEPQPPGSPIQACCLDSDITGIRGCYICDYKWENCTWEPAPESKGKIPTAPDKLKEKDLAPPK